MENNPQIFVKQILIVTIDDGRTIELDLSKYPDSPKGYRYKPAEHPWYAQVVETISKGGISDPESTPYHLKFIPACRLKLIEIKFIEATPTLLTVAE